MFVDKLLTLSLAATGATDQVQIKGPCGVQIVVDAGDAAGTFYLRTACRMGLDCVVHSTLYAPKTAAASLNAKLDYTIPCGEALDVYYDRTSGGTGQTASIYIWSL